MSARRQTPPTGLSLDKAVRHTLPTTGLSLDKAIRQSLVGKNSKPSKPLRRDSPSIRDSLPEWIKLSQNKNKTKSKSRSRSKSKSKSRKRSRSRSNSLEYPETNDANLPIGLDLNDSGSGSRSRSRSRSHQRSPFSFFPHHVHPKPQPKPLRELKIDRRQPIPFQRVLLLRNQKGFQEVRPAPRSAERSSSRVQQHNPFFQINQGMRPIVFTHHHHHQQAYPHHPPTFLSSFLPKKPLSSSLNRSLNKSPSALLNLSPIKITKVHSSFAIQQVFFEWLQDVLTPTLLKILRSNVLQQPGKAAKDVIENAKRELRSATHSTYANVSVHRDRIHFDEKKLIAYLVKHHPHYSQQELTNALEDLSGDQHDDIFFHNTTSKLYSINFWNTNPARHAKHWEALESRVSIKHPREALAVLKEKEKKIRKGKQMDDD